MSESFATTYAKAIDDLAGKIFIPALISSLLVEFGPAYQNWQSAGLIETYLAFAFGGCILAEYPEVQSDKQSLLLDHRPMTKRASFAHRSIVGRGQQAFVVRSRQIKE